MKEFIGVKVVKAEPMVKDGKDGYKVVYPDGYESWSPKNVFEVAYRDTSGKMTLGLAIEAMKFGLKVAREGWNGKGLFVVYQKAYPQGIPCNKQTAAAWGMKEGELFKCEPYFQINTVNGSHSMWVPSIGDCLAEDWMVVSESSSTETSKTKMLTVNVDITQTEPFKKTLSIVKGLFEDQRIDLEVRQEYADKINEIYGEKED